MAGPIQSEINSALTTTAGGIAAGKQLYEQKEQKAAAAQTAINIAAQTKQQAEITEYNRREAIMKDMESEGFLKNMDSISTHLKSRRNISTSEGVAWLKGIQRMYNKTMNPARQTELDYLQGKVKYEDVIKARENLFKHKAEGWLMDDAFIRMNLDNAQNTMTSFMKDLIRNKIYGAEIAASPYYEPVDEEAIRSASRSENDPYEPYPTNGFTIPLDELLTPPNQTTNQTNEPSGIKASRKNIRGKK